MRQHPDVNNARTADTITIIRRLERGKEQSGDSLVGGPLCNSLLRLVFITSSACEFGFTLSFAVCESLPSSAVRCELMEEALLTLCVQ